MNRFPFLNVSGAVLALLLAACASRPIEIIAHRGASASAPENTLPAIRRAIDLGCDSVELDVQATRDGRLVLIHDPTLERTTTGRGRVGELTYAEIAAMDAGVKFSESFRGTRVPLLEEALDLAGGRIKLYLDLKLNDPAAAVAQVRQRGMSRVVQYRAVTLQSLERIRYLDPEAEIVFDPDIAIDVPGLVEAALERLPGALIGSRVSLWHAAAVERARRLGARTIINVIGDECTEENLRKAVALRPSAILTDDPARLQKILRPM